MHKIIKMALTISALISTVAAAEDTADEYSDAVVPFVKVGYSVGGDDMGGLQLIDGDDPNTTAGGGLTLGTGFYVPLDEQIGLDLSVSYQVDTVSASNGEVTMDRYVLSVLPKFKLWENFSLSGGLEYHADVQSTIEFDGQVDVVREFNTAIGYTAQATYHLSSWQLSLKYVYVDYKLTESSGVEDPRYLVDDFDASNIGLFLSYSFSGIDL